MPTITATRASLFSSVPSEINCNASSYAPVLGVMLGNGSSSYQVFPPIRDITLSTLITDSSKWTLAGTSISKYRNYGGGTSISDGKKYDCVNNCLTAYYGISYNISRSGTTETKSVTFSNHQFPTGTRSNNNFTYVRVLSNTANTYLDFKTSTLATLKYPAGSSYSYTYSLSNCGTINQQIGYFTVSGSTYIMYAQSTGFNYNFALDWTGTNVASSKYGINKVLVEVNSSNKTGATSHSDSNIFYFKYLLGTYCRWKVSESTTWHRQITFTKYGATSGYYVVNGWDVSNTQTTIPYGYTERGYFMSRPLDDGQSGTSDHSSPWFFFWTDVNYTRYGYYNSADAGGTAYGKVYASSGKWHTERTRGLGMTYSLTGGNGMCIYGSGGGLGTYNAWWQGSDNSFYVGSAKARSAGWYGFSVGVTTANTMAVRLNTNNTNDYAGGIGKDYSITCVPTSFGVRIEYTSTLFEGNYQVQLQGGSSTGNQYTFPFTSSTWIDTKTLYLWGWCGAQTNNGNNRTTLVCLGSLKFEYRPKGTFTMTKY